MFAHRVMIIALLSLWLPAIAIPQGNPNLALKARATASESYPDLTPNLAIDGRGETRWSGIPGHVSGLWFELDWDHPVEIGQILVRQCGRYTMEWDVQTWEQSTGMWVAAGHFGKPGVHLPGNVYCAISPPRTTTKIRLANITNGPSFNEIEVYSRPILRAETIEMASDLQGNFVGMVCDAIGDAPIENRRVTIQTSQGIQTVVSGANGMFFSPMPERMRGAVTVQSSISPKKTLRLEEFQRGLVPVDGRMPKLTLDGGWKFEVDPSPAFHERGFDDSKWSRIRVPAHWEMEGHHSRSGIAGYRVHFSPPAGSGRVMLRFDGVYSGAKAWVNGHYVAGHFGGFSPFETDITDELLPGVNVLAVEVKEKTDVSELLDKMSQYADFSLGGVMRKVTLYRVPTEHIAAFEQATTFRSDRRVATVSGVVRLAVSASKGQAKLTSADVQLLDREGRLIANHKFLDANQPKRSLLQDGRMIFSLLVQKPNPWSAETPYLYTLRFLLKARSGQTVQVLDQKIGLRQTEVRGTEILINKSPVKFRGTCHHDQHPLMGRAVTPELERRDVELMKEANLNSLRTSHYPPLPELLDEADRQGMYVEDEAPFCWVGSSDDLRFTPRIIQLTAELIARDRNHPSVFMWSLCNESTFGYGFEQSHDWVRRIDPSRPTGAATSATLEVATLHNPLATQRIHDAENGGKPLLFDESIAPFQGIFRDVAEMWVDPGIRDYYSEPFISIYREFMKSKVTQGSMIWAWSDDLFCVPNRGFEYGREQTLSHFVDDAYALPGRGLVGDAPWGVVDGWRRRKPEFWIVKKLHSPIKMDEQPVLLKGTIRLKVANEYDFLTLRQVRVEARAERDRWIPRKPNGPVERVVEFQNLPTSWTDVGPRTSGVLSFKLPEGQTYSAVVVNFYNSTGSLIDAYRFTAASEPHRASGHSTPMEMTHESTLSGELTVLRGPKFQISFDQTTGQIRRCVLNGVVSLVELPSIHVLPTATPLAQQPLRQHWHLDSMSIRTEGYQAFVSIKGRYPNLVGGYELKIDSNGGIETRSSFVYSGPDLLVRELGMQFSVPRTMQTLRWERNAEWGVYPAEHIGRPVGEAKAIYPHSTTVPPTWPWSQDNTPMGSNDFRSTKRHVRLGWIGIQNGSGVQVLMDGIGSLRAWLETDRSTVTVNDFYGGTNVGWGEWITNYGRGKLIKTGDTLISTLRLKLVEGG